jgi:hypothetical protein
MSKMIDVNVKKERIDFFFDQDVNVTHITRRNLWR